MLCRSAVSYRQQIVHVAPISQAWSRNASLTSAISSGVRKAADALKKAERQRLRQGTLAPWELKDERKVAESQSYAKRARYGQDVQRQRLNFLSQGSQQLDDGNPSLPDYERQRRARANAKARSQGMLVDAPHAVPYTEAASEFLYGTFAVLSALSASKRKMHKLYIWCGEDGSLMDGDDSVTEIVRLAKGKIPVVRVAGNWDKMLDRMSDKRPHNGVVLETGPIPKVMAKALGKTTQQGDPATIILAQTTSEQRAALGIDTDGTHLTLPVLGGGSRYPFMLWLDKVTDTGNLGAIFRTAYFLGVDAIIVPSHGTAPLTAIAIKASAGAAERVPVIQISKELEFMRASQTNGWRFYATGAADSLSTVKSTSERQVVSLNASPDQALKHHPSVLVLGNEGEGLRPFLQKQADHTISIPSARKDSVIDSLNVSVAAALLAQRFLAGSIR